MELRRSVNGALAGGVAAAVWAAQQPVDKRLFGSDYDDVELLGKLVTRDSGWSAAGLTLHMANGALFGAIYAQLRPFLPGSPPVSAVTAAMAENFAAWPLARLVDRFHPARDDLPVLSGNHRVLVQSTWRHLIFALVLGELERRLNAPSAAEEPRAVPVSSNGHGNIEMAVGAA